ncbi:hypothetical protein UlMin_040727 [Ulmus minor]
MPIYAMHTARIPKAICAKLDARIRRFWWGSKEENARPLCLKAWDDLCVPKAYGGLGLRRMSAMNEAMLAKWGWDLLTGKRSQCLLFLQGKYLRAGSFISVEAVEACMVKDLFSHSGHWDTHKVRSIFIPEDASRILSIQMPIRPSRDYWCWLPASSGKFSARSFYLFVNNQRFVAASNIPKKVWLSIWNANILPRHKLLWWQILSNCLPTKTRINRCIPGIDTICPLCGLGSESLLHLLLFCDIAKVIWFSSPWNIRYDALPVNDPADLLNMLLKMDEMLGCGNLLLFASIMFDLVWKCRNEVVHGGVSPGPVMLLRRILKSFNDTTCSLSRSTSVPASWCPPPLDWIKFSMDAAVGVSCSCAAMVVRDHTGSLLFWKSSKVFSVDPVVVEAQAMLLAISCVVSMFAGCCCWFESDAKTVVDSILIPTVPLYWPISAVSSNCRILLDYIFTWHMSHAIRSRNVYAHNVARWCLLHNVYDDFSHVLLPSSVLSDVKE